MATVRFLFDFISPYAYLAWTQIHDLAARHSVEVEPVPVLFAGLLEAHGTLGPAEVPAKRRYLLRDVARRARLLGVPVQLPFAHPFNPLLALRVASLPAAAAVRKQVVDALFRATWVEGANVTEPSVVRDIATRAGLGSDAIELALSDAGKLRVREQTERAVAAGVFGVPSMLVDGELFWGGDSLPLLEGHLSGELGGDDVLSADWQSLPAQAVRRRR